jgi:4-amino-4-deoxy-L-arabinose transferase-like glycosyltransferase
LTARGRALALLLALAALLVLPLLGSRDLWAPDEPRYAQASAETLEGHWWRPYVNGHPYPDKPPLYFWLAAAASLPAGRVTEGSARLPSALAFLALVALTFHLGRSLVGDVGGSVAAAAVATTWLTAWMGRRVCLDVLLAALAAAAIALALAAGRAARIGERRRAALLALLAGGVVALGNMTKGPVVLLPVGCALLGGALAGAARRDRPRRWLAMALILGATGCAIGLAAWLVPAHLISGYDPFAVVQDQVVDRAAEGRHHIQPPWYFLIHVPLDFMPWTLFAVPAMIAAWRRRPWASARDAMLLAWALAPLVLLSISVEKRNIYALPVVPAWALLIGAWVQEMASGASAGLRRATIAACALLGLSALGGLLLALAGARLGADARLAFALPGVRAGMLAVVAIAALAAFALARIVREPASPARLVHATALSVGAFLLGIFLLLPRFDPLKSGRSMGALVRREAGNGPVGMVPRTWDTYVFYSGRSIEDLADAGAVIEFLKRSSRPAHVLANADMVAALPEEGGLPPEVVGTARVGDRDVVLLRYGQPRRAP